MVRTGSGCNRWPSSRRRFHTALSDDVPCLLAPGRVTTPAIGVLLHVFIGQGIFKRTAMQVEAHHIRSRQGALGEIRQEELVDDASTCNPNPTPGGPGRMGGDDDTDPLACFVQALVRTVVERAY